MLLESADDCVWSWCPAVWCPYKMLPCVICASVWAGAGMRESAFESMNKNDFKTFALEEPEGTVVDIAPDTRPSPPKVDSPTSLESLFAMEREPTGDAAQLPPSPEPRVIVTIPTPMKQAYTDQIEDLTRRLQDTQSKLASASKEVTVYVALSLPTVLECTHLCPDVVLHVQLAKLKTAAVSIQYVNFVSFVAKEDSETQCNLDVEFGSQPKLTVVRDVASLCWYKHAASICFVMRTAGGHENGKRRVLLRATVVVTFPAAAPRPTLQSQRLP